MALVDRMRAAAEAFLRTLAPDQLRAATADFDVPDHRAWTYLPGPRPGLRLGDITAEQRRLALDLLETGLSAAGAATAHRIIELERILDDLIGYDSQGDPYWVRVLGDPSGSEPWAWRLNGHHLGVHSTVVGDQVRATPSFFGAQPAVVPRGPHAGLRTLAGEEELARELLAALEPVQRSVAIVSDTPPDDIRTRFDPVADPDVLPVGLAAEQMTQAQRQALVRLVRHYVDRAPDAVGQPAGLNDVLDSVSFAWAGSDERGAGHYYCVRGPTFLIEYDNTQNDANHIHSVWRDLTGDWGEDLLAAHYLQDHR